MKLSDESILFITKLLQIAILSGTDIVDNLRNIQFEKNDSDMLDVTKASEEVLQKTIDEMLSGVKS